MDSKYKILIIIIIIIIGAYVGFSPGKHYDKLQIAGSTSVQPVLEKLADKYQEEHPNVRINVQGGGSGLGIRTTDQGIVNIGMVSESLGPENKNGLTQYVIAKDGIVIAVNNANTVNNLTTDQIRNIFSGNITNWDELGGSDQEIHVVVREAGSGTLQSFQDLIMGQTKIRGDAIVQSSTESVKQAVKQDPGAIGFISLANLDNTIKPINLDGISPSQGTVENGSYKLQRPFELIVKGSPTGITADFINWVLGPEGQDIIESQKVVPENQTII